MKEDPVILGLETATRAGSVCLARGTEILSILVGDTSTSHSNTLLRDINRVLENAGTSLADINLFAVAVGPGSFTGLRIGLATTKALASTLSRSCLSVPTLAAVASSVGRAENVVALLPAGRGEVFAQLFSVNSPGDVRALDDPAHLPPAIMLERYARLARAIWAGDGAHLYRDLIFHSASVHPRHWSLAEVDNNLAKQVVLIGLKHYQEQQTVAPESLQAIYVRPSDAELNVLSH